MIAGDCRVNVDSAGGETERTWLQLVRSCALHLVWCPNLKTKVLEVEVGSAGKCGKEYGGTWVKFR